MARNPLLVSVVLSAFVSFGFAAPAVAGHAPAYAGDTSGLHFSGKRIKSHRFKGNRHFAKKIWGKSGGKFGHHGGHFASAKILHGPAFGHRGFGHHSRSGSFNGSQIAIVVGAVAGAGSEPYIEPGAAFIEGGTCAPGQYCTLRLGAGSSAPKIITLNSGSATITCGPSGCPPVN